MLQNQESTVNMTTSKQDADFIETIIPNRLLETAIEWIENNMSPEDVFTKNTLENWANDSSSLCDEMFELKSQILKLESTEEELRDEKLILESTIEDLREEIYSLQEKI